VNAPASHARPHGPAHPDDPSLQAFLAGSVDESAAVLLALHLDDCPRCAARAAALDPLAAAFVAPVPPAPRGLAASARAAAAEPVRPGPELALGLTLLSLAAGLLVLAGPAPALPTWAALPPLGAHSAALAVGAVAGLVTGLGGALLALRRPARAW